MYHGIGYKLYSKDGAVRLSLSLTLSLSGSVIHCFITFDNQVYISNPHAYRSRYQLFFRCAPGHVFPLGLCCTVRASTHGRHE